MGGSETGQGRPIRVVICWDLISGYIAACWRAIAAQPGIELRVAAVEKFAGANVAFDRGVVAGLDVEMVTLEQLESGRSAEIAADYKPDVVVVCGWGREGMRKIPFHPSLRDTPVMMTMDTPVNWTWRQRMGRLARGRYFDRIDRVAVASERAWQLARLLGFAEHQIVRGCYAIDWRHFAPVAETRFAEAQWPHRFLYMGRYVNDKALDVLARAYTAYRGRVDSPWPLRCCGSGEYREMIRAIDGVEDAGFVQPDDQPEEFLGSGCFVMPSRFEPFGVALVEAAATGLPLVASESVGATVGLLHDGFNGRRVPTEREAELTEALVWMHGRSDRELAEMGRRSHALARPHGADVLGERWARVFRDMVSSPRRGRSG